MTDITPMIDNSGNEYDIPTKELEQFKADMGTGVQRQYLYRTEDGQDFAIPENDAKAFLNDFPNARPVRRIQLLGGETEDIPSNEMSQFFQRYETDDRYKYDREYDAAVKAGEEARKEYAAAKRRSAEATARLRELEEKNQWMDDTIEFFKGVGRTLVNPEKEYREVLGDDHIATRMIASGNDAANSIVAGVLKIPYDIQKVLGFVAGGRNTSVGNWLIDDAQKTEAWIDSKLPQHTKEKYMSESEAEIANTIQNMTSTLFNFTLTAGVGGAVGASTKAAGGAVAGQRAANATIVAMDSSDAYIDTYDRAIARGAEPSEANALANQAFIWNAIMEGTLINGGLNPMLNSANKLAATPTIDLTKHTFSGITRGLTVGTLRNYAAKTTGHVLSTAAIMGTDKAGKESIRQVADGEEVDFEKIAEAGKSGLVEGGVMGAVFGSAAGFTAAGEFRACHKAMKKKFGDMIIKNVETARGREMMAAANPKGTYDFLKARENGGVPSRKQADRMILPDTLSGKQRAEIADKFLKDGITPEKIKADMFDRIPKAKTVEPKAEPPKQALPPPASTPETPAEQPVPPVEPPKTAESTAGSTVVKPVEAGVSKTTPGAETPSEAVLERSTQAAVQQKTATTPAEAPVEEAKTPAETTVVAENATQIVENGKETPKTAEETAPEQPVSTAPEAVSEAPTPQNAVEAPTSASTETQPITPPEPAKAATGAPVTPDGASAAKDAPKDAVEPATPPEKAPEAPQSAPETATAPETTPVTAPDTDFSVTPQNTGKTVTEQKTASIARLDGLMQTAGELSRKRDEANKARNREALKQTAGLSDERAKLREEIATLNSEFTQSRKSIPPEQMDAAVKKYNNAVAKRNKRIQEIENEIAKIHNEATDNSPLGETTVDLGGGTRIRLEMSEPSIKKVRAAISKSMSSLRIEKKPTVEKVEKAMSSIAAKLDPNESRTKRISIVHREDGVMVATDSRMAFTYADDSIKGDNVIDYPNWRMVIPEDRSLTQSPLKIDLAHLHEKASRAAVCSRGNDEMLERMPYMIVRPNGKKGATVDFIGHGGDGKAIFSTTDNPAGAIHVATVNPEFLLKTVKAAAAAGEKELTLKWENAQRPIVLAGEKCKAVIMPLRNTQTAHSDKPIDSVLGLKELYGSADPAESAAKAPEVKPQDGGKKELSHDEKVDLATKIVANQVRKDTKDTSLPDSRFRDGAERLVNMIEKKNADGLRDRFNGLNKGSVKAFEAITGIKMPSTQKGQHEIVDRFCGITPDQRAKIEADRVAAHEARVEAERRARALEEGEQIMKETRIRLHDGRVATAQQLLEEGWNVKKVKRGATTNLHLIDPKKSGYVKVKGRAFEYADDFIAKRDAAKAREDFDHDSIVLSGDEVRKSMPGYNRLDWRTHVDKTGFVAPRMEGHFQHLLKTRKGKGNGSVAFLAGGNGSGKSTATKNLIQNFDFIVDSTLGNLDVARKQIKAILDNGQKPSIFYVYRNPVDALNGVIERAESGGHMVSPLSFANSHVKARENVGLLAKEFGDKINVTIIDNSKSDKPFISLEELEKKEKIEHEQLRKQAADRIAEVEARTGLGGRRTGEAGAVKGGSEKAGGEVTAEKSFLPGGVIEARRSLESDNGVPPDGWRYLGSSEGNFAVKLPDEKTLREYIEKNFGPIEGEIEAGVKAGGEIYNINEILLKMAGAKSEVKPMSETVAETQASDSVTPQKKLDTYREYAKSVVLREGATIADIQNALMNVPEKIGDVTEADVFFERLKSLIVKEFRADKHAIDLNKKYQSTTDASKRQSIEREFRDHQNKFFQNFLDNRKDDIIKAFDELELKPGDTVSNMAKREAGIPQETIGDIAADVAADVDAAIAAEESGADPSAVAHAPAKPAETVESPRGRGTGTLSQDDPVSRGTGTGKRKIVTPQTFLRRARELFPDVAFRQKGTARMKGWAAGHFEPYYRLIRSRDMNSIGTVAHELGHDIEHLTRYDVLRLPAVKRDLSDLGHHLYGNGPKPPSYIGEGFAEYVRGYICNAPNLSTVAPDLDAWFKGSFKAKHPAIVKKLDELRDMVQTMKEQSAAEAVGGFMRPSTESISRAWHKTLDFFSGENWNDSASIILRGMKKSGIDKIFRWQDDFKKLEASKDLYERRMLADMISDKVENNPYIFATITRGTASQRVMDMARYGTTNLLGNKKTGESLKDIFADFSVAEREAWKKYAIAKHGIENYFKKGMNFGLPREVLEDVVSKYETPKFSLALQRYTDYSHRILHLGVESGLISQETYDKIVNDHPIYVRITRRYADDGAHTRQSGQAINRRTGGFDHILDPIDAALMDQEKFLRACFQAKTLQLIVGAGERAATQNIISARMNGGPDTTNTNPVDPAHNAVGAYWPVEVPNAQEAVKFSAAKLQKGLTDAAKDYSGRTGEDFIPLQEFIDDLATTKDAQGRVAQLSIFRDKPSYGKHNLVSVHVDGKLRTFELPDMKWANMLTDVYDKSDFNFLEKMFGLATAGIRLGATTVNPGFAVRNGIRDSLHSAVMSETGAIPGVSTLYGMGQQLLGSEAAELFRAMGGHMSDLVGITKEQKWNHGGKVALAQNPLQTVGAYSSLDWVLMKPVIKAFSDVLSIPELGPRINEMSAVMAKCRKAGLSENACAILAMSHAKDISIDFQRAGRFMKHINHFIPFSNAMWRGTEQTIRNFGILPSLPHQFEDSNPKRGTKTAIRGLAFITSWAVLLAMLEMSGDDKKKRAAFERSKEEKWNYAYVGDWRIPLPFEVGHIFGALPKAAIYEMNGDEGAVKECLETFGQSLPVKYANPDTAIGSISMLTPWIGLLSNRDYRDRPIVPEHIMENAEKQDWYTQYTTELSKKIGSAVGASPAQLEYLLDSYTGGLYRRVALMAENVDDVSRLQEGRGFSMLDTLRARPQANRLIEDFYKFGVEGKRKFGSGNITLEEYGKLASQNPVKKQLTAKFDEMRAARADKSLPLAEQDRRVREISEEAYEIVRKFNAKDDYRKRGIASAADALTDREASDLDEKKKARLLELLKGVSKNEIVTSLIEYGSELVPIKIRGVETYHQRWSSQNINQRVTRLLMLLQD